MIDQRSCEIEQLKQKRHAENEPHASNILAKKHAPIIRHQPFGVRYKNFVKDLHQDHGPKGKEAWTR